MKSNFKFTAFLAVALVMAAVIYVVPVAAPVNALAVNNSDEAAASTEAPEEPHILLIDEDADNIEVVPEIEDPAAETTVCPIPGESDADETEPEVVPETTEPKITEPEPEETITPATDPEYHEEEPHDDGCNHFWRQEYQPETETEDGYIYESCLYCGEYKLIQTIPAYGNN